MADYALVAEEGDNDMVDYQWKTMCDWLNSAGGLGFCPHGYPSMKPETFEMGGCLVRGLAATRDFQPGDILLSVPLYCTLIAEELPHPYENASWGSTLASAILRERARGSESPWYWYLKTLPPRVLTPVQMSDEELETVEYRPFIDAAIDLRFRLKDDFQACPPMSLEGCSEEEFIDLMSVVYSRTFRLEGRRYMIPAVDFLNHHDKNFQVEWVLDVNEGFVHIGAVAPIAAGDQIFASYGERSNDDFLLFYGFMPTKNLSDDFEIFTNAKEAVEWYSEVVEEEDRAQKAAQEFERAQLEEAAKSSTGNSGTPKTPKSPKTPWSPQPPKKKPPLTKERLESAAEGALQAAQAQQTKMEDEEKELEMKEQGWKHGKKASETCLRVLRGGKVDERLVVLLEHFHTAGIGNFVPLEVVKKRCEDLLETFTTSAEDDVNTLSGGVVLPEHIALLVRYRLAKKVVLMTVAEMCRITTLDSRLQGLKKEMKDVL